VTVLCFADTRFPIERANGVQTMATCHALAGRGHDVTLVVRPDSAPVPRDPFAFYGLAPAPRLHVRTVPAGRPGRARRIRFLLAAARLAAARRDHVVFTRDLGLAAWLLQLPKAGRPPVVYESHGLADTVAAEMPALLGKPALAPSPAKLHRLARREARVWARASAYVTITRALADELTGRFGQRTRVFVVPDGARPADADAPPPAPRAGDAFVAAYAGHLYPWKGVDVFVRALPLAPDVHALIVGGHPGEPDADRVRRLVGELGLEARVTITGLVPPQQVRTRLAGASALVLPNTASAIAERYTSPLKLFEYLTMRMPIVASDLPAVREVLEDRRTALLVPPGDPRALAAALSELKRDQALARLLGEAAAALAPRYTWAARAERLEAAFEAARAS
jgi:glycosyltransferase involved in cell wall biosynthesis